MNSHVYIRFDSDLMFTQLSAGKRIAGVDILVTFRLAGSATNSLARHSTETLEFLSASGQSDSFLEYNFTLKPGRYRVAVEVTESKGGRNHFSESDFSVPDGSRDFICSDLAIFNLAPKLTFKPFPLVGEKIPGETETILFHSEIRASRGDILTGRAVLFQEISRPGPGTSLQYSSVSQVNQIFHLDVGTAAFSGSFEMGNLPAGKYLVEIYLYYNENLVARESRAFDLQWKGLRAIYDDLDAAIRRMKYAAPQREMERLMAITDPVVKKAEFAKYWLNREAGSDGLSIREYYSRIAGADEMYSEDAPGSETDRGKTFIRYGAPDSRNEYTSDHVEYEAWYYDSWNLKFLFRKTGTLYKLMIP